MFDNCLPLPAWPCFYFRVYVFMCGLVNFVWVLCRNMYTLLVDTPLKKMFLWHIISSGSRTGRALWTLPLPRKGVDRANSAALRQAVTATVDWECRSHSRPGDQCLLFCFLLSSHPSCHHASSALGGVLPMSHFYVFSLLLMSSEPLQTPLTAGKEKKLLWLKVTGASCCGQKHDNLEGISCPPKKPTIVLSPWGLIRPQSEDFDWISNSRYEWLLRRVPPACQKALGYPVTGLPLLWSHPAWLLSDFTHRVHSWLRPLMTSLPSHVYHTFRHYEPARRKLPAHLNLISLKFCDQSMWRHQW